MDSFTYILFNNSTLAGLVTVFIGGGIALWQYNRQKSIDRENDRKEEVIDTLVSLKEKVKYSLFILDRMVNTRSRVDSEARIKVFLEALEKHEIPRLSNTLNEDIPLLDMKIANFIDLYFSKKSGIKTAHELYKRDLKIWYDFVINEIPSSKFRFDKKTSEISGLSIVNLEKNIKSLIMNISTS